MVGFPFFHYVFMRILAKILGKILGENSSFHDLGKTPAKILPRFFLGKILGKNSFFSRSWQDSCQDFAVI